MVFCSLVVLSSPATEAPETATETNDLANETLRSYLHLQEQLRATQSALERNRQETEALAARNAEAVAARFKAIETAISTQRIEELNTMKSSMETLERSMESNNRMLMTVAGTIASVGFLVLLLTAYLQWRSVSRLAEFSALVQSARVGLLPPSPTEAQFLGAGDPVQSGQRLSSALTHLEKRIFELEHTAHGPAAGQAIAPGEPALANGAVKENGEKDPADHDAVLLAKGQSLLNLDKAVEALACFDEILRAEPNHAEALVKKGLALEELRQMDEALQCYDRAIAANSDLTIAYLQKGGLFNRLERYEEALQCYEQALQAQEKAHAA
jgi:tetratricopeptide (TPR) repeat protein